MIDDIMQAKMENPERQQIKITNFDGYETHFMIKRHLPFFGVDIMKLLQV